MSTPGPTRAAGAGLADRAAEAFAAYRTGDRHRMGELVDLVSPVLWHVARGQGAGPEVAEDAVQTTWLTLLDKSDQIREPQAVLGWLMTTVRREAIRASRRSGRERVGIEETPEPTAPAPAPLTRVELDERQGLLWGAVQSLSERCRQLLRVVAFAERPDYAAISQALGMPVGSIGPTRGRCLDKLRGTLEAEPRWEGYHHG